MIGTPVTDSSGDVDLCRLPEQTLDSLEALDPLEVRGRPARRRHGEIAGLTFHVKPSCAGCRQTHEHHSHAVAVIDQLPRLPRYRP